MTVVDESGAPATTLEPNAELFDLVTLNTADNAIGQINFSATKFDSLLQGSFTAATIQFRAKAKVDVTDAVFAQSGVLSPVLSPVEGLSKDGARMSDLYQGGEPLNATLGNSSDITCWAERLEESYLE